MQNELGVMVADATIAVRKELSTKRRNCLDHLLGTVGEAVFVSTLVGSIYRVPVDQPVPLVSMVSSFAKDLRAEAWVDLVEGALSKKYWGIFKERFVNQAGTWAIDREMKSILQLGALTSSDGYQPVSTKAFKAKAQGIADAVEGVVGVIPEILDRLIESNAGLLAIESMVSSGHHCPGIQRLRVGGRTDEQVKTMFDSPIPMKMDDNLNLNPKSINGDAAAKIINMKFNLNEKHVKAMATICVDDVLVDILGKAAAKAARDSILDGIAEWRARGCAPWFSAWYSDFRCRVYQLGLITSTGSKAARSMLRSAEKKALGSSGYRVLLEGIAGAMGLDKRTWAERLDYAQANLEQFIGLGYQLQRDPVQTILELIAMGADDTWAALAICLELAEVDAFVRRGGKVEEFSTDILISRDATCSGIQFYSILARNTELSTMVNIVANEDGVGDIYSGMANGMLNTADGELAGVLTWFTGLEQKQRRSLTKKLVMVGTYGGTDTGLADGCLSIMRSGGMVDSLEAFNMSRALVKLYRATLKADKVFQPLGELQGFFKAVAREFSQRKEQVSLTMPEFKGYEAQTINMAYFKEVGGQRHISAINGKKITLFSYGLELGEAKPERMIPDYRKQVSAMSPNTIHYCDATLLGATVLDMAGASMNLCHDSFGCHPADMDEMVRIIKANIIALYLDSNVLESIKGGVEIPTCVGMVTDEYVDGIMQGEYSFC